jgi:enoyl-CoA hydratase/carnithine racemase
MNELIVSREREGVALLRLNRPDAKNALNVELRQALAAACDEIAVDDSIRSIVITGGSDIFAAGADLSVLADQSPTGVAQLGFAKLWRSIATFPKPMIAAVNGFALGGGCELALHCDMIIAGRTAKFGQPEVNVGIMPGAGGTQRLVRAIGKYSALHMLLTGTIIDAERAYALGLVNELVDAEETLERALKVAEKMARLPAMALASIKKVVAQGADLPLDAALALEYSAFQLLFDTEDQKEGMKAFLEKRKPNFKGA